MRAGGYTVQQALTAEAASVVKQAVALARQRGHAQVTPLHVANTMLSSPTALLRKACLQSHSHPLQCRALELCFNVALNRLPASSSSSSSSPPATCNPTTLLLGGVGLQLQHQNHQHPAISNALVAAFKRAQAHQRRGSIENQQQPLLVVKIELEQLIISILDDPSVSRVMREAGFSSTKVKTNVEQAIPTLDLSTPPPPPSNTNSDNSSTCNKDEDVISVIKSLESKRRKSLVVVGECIESIESVVEGLMEKVEKGDVPEALRGVKFISIPFYSFADLRREEVEQKMGELTCLVRSLLPKGVVLYLGDLKWITDYRASNNSISDDRQELMMRGYCYCPVEHAIMELGRLVYGFGGGQNNNGNVWLMGTASIQTYMRCRTGLHHSLQTLWALHPLTMPAGTTLALSLLPADSSDNNQSVSGDKKDEDGESDQVDETRVETQLNCCADCSSKFEVEFRNLQMSRCSSENESSTLSSLPSWLHIESKRSNSNNGYQISCASSSVQELCGKWNSICSSVHKKVKAFERASTFPDSSPSINSCFSQNQQYYQSCTTSAAYERPRSLRAVSTTPADVQKQGLLKLNSASCTINNNSTSSSDDTMEMDYVQKFKAFNAENLNILCDALEKQVWWHKDIIPEIAGTILQCRSGMVKRKDNTNNNKLLTSCRLESMKQDTWLLFQGQDLVAKEKVARELARLVFGSYSNFESVGLSSFSSPTTTRMEDSSSEELIIRNKRSRDEQSCSSYMERFAQALSSNPHRVFFLEDVEQADYISQKGLKRAMERGRIANTYGEEVSLGDAIVILSCEEFMSCRSSSSRSCSPSSTKQKPFSPGRPFKEDQEGLLCPLSLDLNLSFETDESIHSLNQPVHDTGILDQVDRCIVFRL